MDTAKKIVTDRRAIIGALVVMLIAGIAIGMMSYGPSEEERTAYALACEAIRQQLPEDQRDSAVIPSIKDAKVDVMKIDRYDGIGSYHVKSTISYPGRSKSSYWIAVVYDGEVIQVSLQDSNEVIMPLSSNMR